MAACVREALAELSRPGVNFRVNDAAMTALHLGAEAYLTALFEDAGAVMAARGGSALEPRDLREARRVRGEPDVPIGYAAPRQ